MFHQQIQLGTVHVQCAWGIKVFQILGHGDSMWLWWRQEELHLQPCTHVQYICCGHLTAVLGHYHCVMFLPGDATNLADIVDTLRDGMYSTYVYMSMCWQHGV